MQTERCGAYAALRNVWRLGALRIVGRVEGAKSGRPGFAAANDLSVPIKWNSAMAKPPCLNVVTIYKSGLPDRAVVINNLPSFEAGNSC